MGLFVCFWVSYHDNSKLRASILTKLGLLVKALYIDHLQRIKFWPSCAPGEGGLRWGEIFWLRLTTANAQCLRLSERFYIYLGVFLTRHLWIDPDIRCTQCASLEAPRLKLPSSDFIYILIHAFKFICKASATLFLFLASIYSYSYILQANEQNIKISIKQTQTQSQYSMPHGRRSVVTPLTRDQK